jgi:hypothetical protein
VEGHPVDQARKNLGRTRWCPVLLGGGLHQCSSASWSALSPAFGDAQPCKPTPLRLISRSQTFVNSRMWLRVCTIGR